MGDVPFRHDVVSPFDTQLACGLDGGLGLVGHKVVHGECLGANVGTRPVSPWLQDLDLGAVAVAFSALLPRRLPRPGRERGDLRRWRRRDQPQRILEVHLRVRAALLA